MRRLVRWVEWVMASMATGMPRRHARLNVLWTLHFALRLSTIKMSVGAVVEHAPWHLINPTPKFTKLIHLFCSEELLWTVAHWKLAVLQQHFAGNIATKVACIHWCLLVNAVNVCLDIFFWILTLRFYDNKHFVLNAKRDRSHNNACLFFPN